MKFVIMKMIIVTAQLMKDFFHAIAYVEKVLHCVIVEYLEHASPLNPPRKCATLRTMIVTD
jgi:hypothetical protein